jgi:hypothetical protein
LSHTLLRTNSLSVMGRACFSGVSSVAVAASKITGVMATGHGMCSSGEPHGNAKGIAKFDPNKAHQVERTSKIY